MFRGSDGVKEGRLVVRQNRPSTRRVRLGGRENSLIQGRRDSLGLRGFGRVDGVDKHRPVGDPFATGLSIRAAKACVAPMIRMRKAKGQHLSGGVPGGIPSGFRTTSNLVAVDDR